MYNILIIIYIKSILGKKKIITSLIIKISNPIKFIIDLFNIIKNIYTHCFSVGRRKKSVQ